MFKEVCLRGGLVVESSRLFLEQKFSTSVWWVSKDTVHSYFSPASVGNDWGVGTDGLSIQSPKLVLWTKERGEVSGRVSPYYFSESFTFYKTRIRFFTLGSFYSTVQ